MFHQTNLDEGPFAKLSVMKTLKQVSKEAKMKQLILLTICSLSLTFSVRAQIPCNVTADIFDTDPNGTNIRRGAGSDFPVIQTVTNKRAVVITDASSGLWLKIKEVYDYDAAGGEWKNKGWIYAPLLGVYAYEGRNNLNNNPVKLRFAPDGKSRVLGLIPSRKFLSLQGCRGGWVKVTYGNQIGWLDKGSICSFVGGEDDCPFETER